MVRQREDCQITLVDDLTIIRSILLSSKRDGMAVLVFLDDDGTTLSYRPLPTTSVFPFQYIVGEGTGLSRTLFGEVSPTNGAQDKLVYVDWYNFTTSTNEVVSQLTHN